jgi:hypothetical protein
MCFQMSPAVGYDRGNMRHLRASEVQSFVRDVRKSQAGLIKEARQRGKPHVFLSHSHLDRANLSGAIALLDICEAPAYLDYEDEHLPLSTSAATADGLRRAIDSCKRMIVAASGQLRLSRWVPWEIGYADGSKGLATVALLPIEREGSVVGIEQEYLDSYPRFAVEVINRNLTIIIHDPRDGRYWTAGEWLFESVD